MAVVEADGTVRGLRKGVTRLRAASKERASVEGSAVILVTDPVAVATVRFPEDSTRLYLGGAHERLVVEILPREAGHAVEIWITQGQYTKFTLQRSYTSMYGGFSPTGKPTSIQSRDPIAFESRIRGDSGTTIITIQPQWVPDRIMTRDVILDGFHIRDEPSQPLYIYADNSVLKNFWIERNRGAAPAIVYITQGTHVFEKVHVRENIGIPYSAVYFEMDANLTVTDSDFSDIRSIHASFGGAGIVSSYGGRLTLRRTKLNQNLPNGPIAFQAYNNG
jgi:hypothetical protein